ncbi:MAG: RbsD/FucU family protein [Streptosporangiaceae bacterium]
MLKGIPALLNADVLYILAAMGHGDELALVDRNFPATATAKRLARLDGANLICAAQAILTVFPLDTFVAEPVTRMQVVGFPDEIPGVQRDFAEVAGQAHGRPVAVRSLERSAFYARTRDAFAVISTSEARPYGCFLLTKGVIA